MTTQRPTSTSDARKRAAERLTVTVTVDTDELREWADRHVDMGNHGVAHVLYAAAKNGETLTEQALREAEKRGAVEALRSAASEVPAQVAIASETRRRINDWLRDRADRLDAQDGGEGRG